VDDLKRKTILGFAQLLIFMGILLFVPAWTLDYWQAWVYLFIFGGSSALITIYLWQQDPKYFRSSANPRMIRPPP
jgi:hypothetical protein